MTLLVEKYGGTSVKDVTRVMEVAYHVRERIEAGHQIVMVVSAPGGMTDELIGRAKSINSNPKGRELDVLLSTGEQVSIALMAMALESLGIKAISYTAPQLGIVTVGEHNSSRIKDIQTDRIRRKLEEGYVVIVAGFQGVTSEGAITTLGRGGSDTSAVALGAALGAGEVDIYTDVDGVYSADPRIVESSVKHRFIRYEEMIEMAGAGAKVLHSRSVELASKYGIDIHLRSAFNWGEGTRIGEEFHMEKHVIRGIAATENLTKLSIEGEGLSLSDTIGAISRSGANIDIITHNYQKGRTEISCIIREEYLDKALSAIENGKISWKKELAKVSVIGLGVKSKGTAASVFDILAKEGIEVEGVSCSEINISCVIPEGDVERAQCALHRELIETE